MCSSGPGQCSLLQHGVIICNLTVIKTKHQQQRVQTSFEQVNKNCVCVVVYKHFKDAHGPSRDWRAGTGPHSMLPTGMQPKASKLHGRSMATTTMVDGGEPTPEHSTAANCMCMGEMRSSASRLRDRKNKSFLPPISLFAEAKM